MSRGSGGGVPVDQGKGAISGVQTPSYVPIISCTECRVAE